MTNIFIKEIFENFDLGILENSPIKITGGITNSLYKVVTNKGIYAIKIINKSKIEKDKNLIKKIENSENISNIAKQNGINSLVALKINNKYVNEYKNIYFLIYDWCEGNVLLSKEINLEHLKIVASSLANLHKIKVEQKEEIIKYKKIDFNYYYNLLKDNNESWSTFFKDNFNKLIVIYNNTYDNYNKLSNQLSYAHKDLNRKNIIWSNGVPNIIDWETSTVSNPCLDFFNSAWFLTEDIKKDKYETFTKEYLSIMNLDDDLEVAINSAIIEECEWLEFSLKRALKFYSNDTNEIKIGKDSIESSLKEIIDYYEKIPLMIEYLNVK